MGQRTALEGANIAARVLSLLPPEAEVTRIEYEGPKLAIYSRNPAFLLTNNQLMADIVTAIRKRLVVRCDEAIRRSPEELRRLLEELVPKEVGLTHIFLDEVLGEATLEVKRAEEANRQLNLVELTRQTGWRIRIRPAAHLVPQAVQQVNYALGTEKEGRLSFYRELGEVIFRPRVSRDGYVQVQFLGASKEVGRSCVLVTTPESRLLLDCGIKPGANSASEAYPRLDFTNLTLDEIDAVIISHAHLDHVGFLPALFKYGYRGPVYCTEPTLPLMTLLFMDYLKVGLGEGRALLYDMKDVREVIRHTITLPYSSVTDITPDTKLSFANAGHILGSAIVHLHIGEGLHNIVYTGDFKFAKVRLLEPASWNFPRAETLIIESTYGAKEDIMPEREEAERAFIASLNQTLGQGGKVIIPVPAVGRAQEIMLVLAEYMQRKELVEVPTFIDGMLNDVTAIHVSYADYLSRELRERIFINGEIPFLSEYFTFIEHAGRRDEAVREGPCIIVATSGMLEGGPVLHYLRELASDPKNKIVFVSYQVSGTLGRRILDGATEVQLMNEEGKLQLVPIRAQVERIEGFSGHSDYNQLIRYAARLRPKLRQVLVNHGERRKAENLAQAIGRFFKVESYAPDVGDAVRAH